MHNSSFFLVRNPIVPELPSPKRKYERLEFNQTAAIVFVVVVFNKKSKIFKCTSSQTPRYF